MNGIIVIDKKKNFTSHDVVAIIKKISKEKVGHTGTLDPMATGVLPLLIGKATQISKYLINHDKKYIATIKLGEKRDTADSEGIVTEVKPVKNINLEKINKILNEIKGKQIQIPPMYSAIKINGKKLYEYAREGKNIEIQGRNIEIYNTKLIKFDEKEQEITFEIECSKGTYIRTVCENIAEKLNTVGYMKELRRIKIGNFNIENSVDVIQIMKDNTLIEKNIITLENFFSNKEGIFLNENEIKQFLNGMKLKKDLKDDLYRIYFNDVFIGIGCVESNYLKRDVILE